MIKAYIQILRPLNMLITLACIILTSLTFGKFSYQLLPIIIVILCLTAFANIINDVFDYKVDKLNRPDRPLPSGKINQKSAIILCMLLLVISICTIFFYDFNFIRF